jgi:hypothetical protein
MNVQHFRYLNAVWLIYTGIADEQFHDVYTGCTFPDDNNFEAVGIKIGCLSSHIFKFPALTTP